MSKRIKGEYLFTKEDLDKAIDMAFARAYAIARKDVLEAYIKRLMHDFETDLNDLEAMEYNEKSDIIKVVVEGSRAASVLGDRNDTASIIRACPGDEDPAQ